MEVEADSEEEAIEKAYGEFKGLTGYAGNGGEDVNFTEAEEQK